MNKLFLFLCLIFSVNAWACGDYDVRALVVMKDGFAGLVINPKTKSEINLKVEFNESAKLSPYIDRFIEAQITITDKMDFTMGTASTINNIKVLVPDPLAQGSGTKMTQTKASDCKKK